MPDNSPKRDYSSFASAAKSRFRHVAEALDFQQMSGVLYAKDRGGWYEVFALQASQYGSETFYVNFGILVPQPCPVAEVKDIKDCGLLIAERLRNIDDTGGFDARSKAEMQASAERVLVQLRSMAIPWFANLGSWARIADEYYVRNPIDEERIGAHSIVYGADFRSAIYGYLLLRAGRVADARRWLMEARRLMSLPVYYTRDGRTVHEKEAFARVHKPEPHEIERLRNVIDTLALIESGDLVMR
ncbi:hypothetical protein GCM10028794_09810 [Silanimonas algicola]